MADDKTDFGKIIPFRPCSKETNPCDLAVLDMIESGFIGAGTTIGSDPYRLSAEIVVTREIGRMMNGNLVTFLCGWVRNLLKERM